MKIEFVSEPPKRVGTTQINMAAAEELIDTLLDNPNEWAKIDYADLYPQHRGKEGKAHLTRISNFVSRVNKSMYPFNEYAFECTRKGTDVYIRVLADERELRSIS